MQVQQGQPSSSSARPPTFDAVFFTHCKMVYCPTDTHNQGVPVHLDEESTCDSICSSWINRNSSLPSREPVTDALKEDLKSRGPVDCEPSRVGLHAADADGCCGSAPTRSWWFGRWVGFLPLSVGCSFSALRFVSCLCAVLLVDPW